VKEEPTAAVEVDRQYAADDYKGHSGSGVMNDQGRGGRTREPGGAASLRVSQWSQGGRSQGEAQRSTGRDGVKRSEIDPQ